MNTSQVAAAVILVAVGFFAIFYNGNPGIELTDRQVDRLDLLDSLIDAGEMDQAQSLLVDLKDELDFMLDQFIQEDNASTRWLYLQGKYYFYSQRYPLAADFLLQADMIISEIDEDDEHEIYSMLEKCHYAMGDVSHRAHYIDKYLASPSSKKHLLRRSKFLLKRAVMYSKQKDVGMMDSSIMQAGEIAKASGDISVITEHQIVAMTLDASLSKSDRLEYLLDLDEAVQESSAYTKHRYFRQLSDIYYFHLKDHKKALEYTMGSLAASMNIPDWHDRFRFASENYTLLADVHMQLDSLDLANKYIDATDSLKNFLNTAWVPFLYGNQLEIAYKQGAPKEEVLGAFYSSIELNNRKRGEVRKDMLEAQKRMYGRDIALLGNNLNLVSTQRNLLFLLYVLTLVFFGILYWHRSLKETIKRQEAEIRILRDQLGRVLLRPMALINELSLQIKGKDLKMDRMFDRITRLLESTVSGDSNLLPEEIKATNSYLDLMLELKPDMQVDMNIKGDIAAEVSVPKHFILYVVAYLVTRQAHASRLFLDLELKIEAAHLLCKIDTKGFEDKGGKEYGFPTLERYLLQFNNTLGRNNEGAIVLHIPYERAKRRAQFSNN